MAASFCRRSFLNYKNCLFQTQKRTGYVVLIPETPEEVSECNVVSLENLPDFSKLTLRICKQIVNKYGQQYDTGAWELDEHLQKKIKESEKVDTIKHIIEPLEVLTVPFFASWGVVKALFISNHSLVPPSTFYPLSSRVLQIRSDKFNIRSIFAACKKQLETDSAHCTEEQRRILKKFVWEGTHNGLELNQKDFEEFQECMRVLQTRRETYEKKYRNSKSLFSQLISDKNFAKDAPLDLLMLTSSNINSPKEGPWIITLHDAVYSRFMEYCSSRDARRHIWVSYNQLGSAALDTRCNVTVDVEDIRRRRRQFARLLGFPSYAHLSMKTKMAEKVENVQELLGQLLEPAKYAQEKEVYELEKFAYDCGTGLTLEMWDLPFWERQQKKIKFGLDEEMLKEYFPLSQVLLGLIALCEQLFGIEIEEQSGVDCWHPDVRYFRVSDTKTKSILGGFYFDPYARSKKLVGDTNTGWFVGMRPRSKICASLPLSCLVFSFCPPTEDQPSLLYHGEIVSLFEKFGQMLQYTLTEMNYSEVSGASNIEWDAVEICGRFMKLWLTEKGTLESISGHYNTGEPFPSHILDNLCNVKKHMAGTDLSREIYFCNLDLELHLKKDACLFIVERLWPEHLLFQLQPVDFHVYGFKNIFSSSWSSSYYSGVWSEMVAADAFAAFAEGGFHNQEEMSSLGKRFRSTFLALGGGCEPGEVFRRFRGRDPTPKSLLHMLNLTRCQAPTPEFKPELVLKPQLS